MGLGEWKNRYRRVMAMSSKELADRLRQQATARIDFLRYKGGAGFEPRFDLKTPARREAHFFFAADSIPQICLRLRERFPKETYQIVERADRICQHRFDLLGYRDLDYGMEIDWHCDRVHGKRAPRKPWFQIRYLDFAEVGDSKVTWELNRHQHFVTLAKAFRLTGDAKFANELFRQWKHWHRENPYPMGINWSSSLEVAFRSLSWLWAYFLMAGSETMPREFRGELYRSLAVSGRHIECHLSTYFSPNTHLLGEGAALFFIGTLCPELEQADRWQSLGWTILQQATERQVRGDGLHFEQSIYYHVYALDFFLHAAVLASRNGIATPARFERTLESMLEGLCVLGRSGPVPRLGDDDGGRLFDGQRSGRAHLLDPLATGAVLFGRGDFKSVAGGPREEMVWLLVESGLAEFDRLPVTAVARGSTAFQDSGLYVMSGDDLERQLVIDAGPQGADTAGHGHADALSITASSAGRALLIDPGTFEYVGEGFERNRFRGTKAHNTLVVDGVDQSEPKGPFSWVSLPNVRAEEWIKGESFDFFVGSHDGFTRLADPVVHRRTVFSLKSRFWLVRDQALGKGKHQLDLFWHLDPELLPIEEDTSEFRDASGGLPILPPDSHGWSQDTRSEDWSPAYGQKERHSVLHFGTVATLPAEFVTLLIPEAGVKADAGKRSLARVNSPSTGESVVCYRFKTEEEEHWFVFGNGKPWTLSQWSSDAEFLCWGVSQDKTYRMLICCNASYVEAQGRKIMSCQRTVSRCETVSAGGGMRVISSDTDTVFEHEALSVISLEEEGS
jgi:hypothetical protein